tara:strand:+ start:1847 stop:2023 length:177 start_codon:yes stop_codon:yes gene_type:complete
MNPKSNPRKELLGGKGFKKRKSRLRPIQFGLPHLADYVKQDEQAGPLLLRVTQMEELV